MCGWVYGLTSVRAERLYRSNQEGNITHLDSRPGNAGNG